MKRIVSMLLATILTTSLSMASLPVHAQELPENVQETMQEDALEEIPDEAELNDIFDSTASMSEGGIAADEEIAAIAEEEILEENDIEGTWTFPMIDSVEVTNVDLPDSETLFEGYVNQTLYPESVGENGFPRLYARSNALSGTDLKLYNALKEKIVQTANGTIATAVYTFPYTELFDQTSFTAAELGVSTIIKNGQLNSAASDAMMAKLQNISYKKVMESLIADLPYELYWFDKTRGYSYEYSVGLSYDSNSISFNEGSYVTLTLTVAVAYSATGTQGTNRLNTTKTNAAKTAATNAAAIVSNAKSMTDYQKLDYYKQQICNAVTYNNAASGQPYGDPWQLIYVFDGNPSTNVVCEGYAKAFKYLCDLSSFSNSKLECYIVTGKLSGAQGAGGHMWNVMVMDNGQNYLVDLTNSDNDSLSSYEDFFLAGSDGVLTNGYFLNAGSVQVSYVYDNYTMELFTDNERTIATTDYEITPTATTPTTPATNVPGVTAYNGVDYSAVYNYSYYINKYVDLKVAFGSDQTAAIAHFVNNGMDEGRQACEDFNVSIYKDNYTDLQQAFGNNWKSYYLHYINNGKQEGRNAKTAINNAASTSTTTTNTAGITVYNGVDYSAVYNYSYYINKYADLKKAYGNNQTEALAHFVNNGMNEGRQASEEFNVSIYKSNYADLQRAFGNNWKSYYLHYMNNGKQEGRNAKTLLYN